MIRANTCERFMRPSLYRLSRCLAWLLAAAPMGGYAACGPYSVSMYEHGILYARSADGSGVGIDKDVIEALAKRTGCTFHMVLDSRVRIWTALEAGTLDMSVSGIASPEREKKARFVTYFKTHNHALLKADLASSATTPDGFLADTGLRVAVVKSFKHGERYDAWLDTLRAQGRVEQAADFNAVWNLFKVGRVQAVLGLPTTWMPLLKQDDMASTVHVMDWFPKEKPILAGLIVSKTRVTPADTRTIENAVRDMHKDGTLETIYARYVNADLAREMVRY